MIRVAEIIPDTRAEGPGRRFALWLQGCSLRCPGCCNPEMIDPTAGEEVSPSQILAQIEEGAARGIEGITLLGGEPFDQAAELVPIAAGAGRIGLGVVAFSGYTLDQLSRSSRSKQRAGQRRLLDHLDVLIDGPFVPGLQSSARRWIGSDNQQVIHLSPRYRDHRAFAGTRAAQQSIEITLENGEILVRGWPAAADSLLPRPR